jgi:hypothetical protein
MAATQGIAAPGVERDAGAPARTTRALLACGAVAGPLFVVVAFGQAFARTGFDLARHPVSMLSLGDPGWIQIANFVVAGVLFVAAAAGIRRVLSPGRGETWVPLLVGAFGVSLIAGGVFVADPALGFPPGTPEGPPDQFSWHGIVHAISPVVGFNALVAACFVQASRFVREGERRWARASVVIGVAVLALSIGSNVARNFLPLWAAIALGFGWASAVSARLMRRVA